MAESDETTTTPADDGRAYVQRNGTVDTGGRPAFVWCEDEGTGHRFDMAARALPKRGVRVVEGYPLNFKRFARRAKTRLELAADPAETDVHGDVDVTGQVPAEPVAGGDEQHAAAVAAAAEPVEAGAPEVVAQGDQQQADAAAAAAGTTEVDEAGAAGKATVSRKREGNR